MCTTGPHRRLSGALLPGPSAQQRAPTASSTIRLVSQRVFPLTVTMLAHTPVLTLERLPLHPTAGARRFANAPQFSTVRTATRLLGGRYSPNANCLNDRSAASG